MESMLTVQIVLDEELLRAADRAARRVKTNRSAFIRDALRSYLRQLSRRERERQDRQGYERCPDDVGDANTWERVAAWPDE